MVEFFKYFLKKKEVLLGSMKANFCWEKYLNRARGCSVV